MLICGEALPLNRTTQPPNAVRGSSNPGQPLAKATHLHTPNQQLEQRLVAGCQATNFTEDTDVRKRLYHFAQAKKWPGKLDYILSELKRRVVNRHIPGAILELGVQHGKTTLLLRHFINVFSPERQLHVYDSFEGLPQRSARDGKQHRPEDGKGGHAVSKDTFLRAFHQARLTPPDGIHKGFFRDIPSNEFPEQIAFAFFDGDLYQSIYDSFLQIYHKCSPGGIIMVHDYTEIGFFPGSKKAIEDFLADKEERVVECYGMTALIVKASRPVRR